MCLVLLPTSLAQHSHSYGMDSEIPELHCHLHQGFSKYGLCPQMGLQNVILGLQNKWLDKPHIQVFVNFARKQEVGLQ